ncbi:hypothetical protein CFN78_13645 [Amycolatopsis antarctica]|uniref:Bacterial bifunctional deaminase-reductase C-terminal domain-containing protein n=1 Tax=Amycolatopsis antarctica TaxID=1854586 RepID=A0A263D2J0_9PSEU|nr:dihydrofolate reductase family protein [Amycolatopsis antarctica]OZM72670.1 hypothetical protein CFN78_13645 [Amycolatopsis antarctica]
MRRIWPPGDDSELDDAALEALYPYPAGRRWVSVNYVSSADGAVAVDGLSAGLTNAADQRVFRVGRDLADVVLVGAGTAVREGFEGFRADGLMADRRRRHGLSAVPPIAVVTTGPSLVADAPVLRAAGARTIVLTCGAAPAASRTAWAEAGARVEVVGDTEVDLPAALDLLQAGGFTRIDCDGGPGLFGSLLAEGLVDELRLTVSPLLVAGQAGRITSGANIDPASLELASTLVDGDTLLLRYLIRR